MKLSGKDLLCRGSDCVRIEADNESSEVGQGESDLKDWDGVPRIFLEGDEVPTAAVGVESKRERSASSALPPLNFIHVWWARRPLAASRFALVGSLIGSDWEYKDVLELLGIPRGKDPVALRARIDEANKRGEKLRVAYGYGRAFTNLIPERLRKRFLASCEALWGVGTPVVLDMFSGGGSIPFEGVRLGLSVESVELNPVASLVQLASVNLAMRYGSDLAKDVRDVGEEIARRVEDQLAVYFPKEPGETIFAYVWVRSTQCPDCGFATPLTPNWWLDRKRGVGFRALVEDGRDSPLYVVAEAGADGFNPKEGNVKRGTGECVRCERPISGGYIKSEAQAGRMWHQLAAIGYKKEGRRGRHFRPPTLEDIHAFQAAEEKLHAERADWEARDLIPNESIPFGLTTAQPLPYGYSRWSDFFNPRQLLTHVTTLEAIRNYEWDGISEDGRRKAVRTLIALAMDKTVDYNSIQSALNVSRAMVKNTFDRHDFAPKWNYTEIDGAGHLFRFGVRQIADAYQRCADLLAASQGKTNLRCADARDLSWLGDESVQAVVTDPPYYANVMYAETSDFFYVWLKRTIGDLYPDWFSESLVDKSAEAVANPANFRGAVEGKGGARKAARMDYEMKMTQAWREAHRVLVPGGVLTIMFNHKQLEAWDALAKSIIEAGFTITASCAISTESEHSLQIREKQAVQRTIFLVARKIPRGEGTWWEDVRKELHSAVRGKLSRVLKETPNVSRIDLLMSAYGEGLRVVSQNWPVRDSRGGNIEIAHALKQARATLQDWYFEARLGHRPDFDLETKVVLYALEGYGDAEATYDDVHKYGLALGLDVEDLYRAHLAERKGSKVKFLGAEERLRRTPRVDPEREEYPIVWDGIQAASLTFREEDATSFRRWLREKGFLADRAFLDACAFLASEGPSELLETKMARAVAAKAAAPLAGQMTLDSIPE